MRILALMFVLLGGCTAPAGPPVVVHTHTYQAVPSRIGENLPPGERPKVGYQTIYPTRPFDDPTLVVIQNESERATFAVRIAEGAPIVLGPGEVTANIHLDIGDHPVQVKGDIPTGLGRRLVTPQLFTIRVTSSGRSQIIRLREP